MIYLAASMCFIGAACGLGAAGYMAFVNARESYHDLWLFPILEVVVASVLVVIGVSVLA